MKISDVDDVRAAVRRIRKLIGDDEAAHAEEDELYAAVLEAVANSHPHSAELAAAALRTKDIAFSRWYA